MVTLLVDENTKFRTQDGGEATFGDMITGRWVIVAAARGDQDEILAKVVVYLPNDFDPEKLSGAAGRIIEVDKTKNTFTLNNREGVEKVITVDVDTSFKGRVESLTELREGMLARVGAELLEDETLLANIVQAGFPTVKISGKITSVEPSEDTFTLKTRRGDRELTLIIDEKTRFRSKDDIVESMDDLQADMIAIVVAEKPDEKIDPENPPVLLAVTVGAATEDQLPKYDWKMGGEIVAVDVDAFTIENRNGKQYTLLVTEDTHFRSRGGVVKGLEDLEVGTRIIVGFDDLGDGIYRAGLVIAGKMK
jgi:hypothetical protein